MNSAAFAEEPVMVCTDSAKPQPETASIAACHLADELEKAFVFPEQGHAYAERLRANVASNRYASLSPREAARLMTRDLQEVAPDGHLRVETEREKDEKNRDPSGKSFPPSLERSGWIVPGVAFLRINVFTPGDSEETAAVTHFMKEHAEAKAIIFDIRTHGGGGLDQMDAIFPWLFAEETRLVTMAMRRSVEEEHGTPFVANSPTLRKLAGTPQETVREHWALPNGDPRLRDVKVYLLTSERTGSAAEHFALAMKLTHRATLVGSNTAGANHFGGGIPLGAGLEAFMPVGRTYDPLSGKDWEGTGVVPDIRVAPENALAVVLQRLGVPPKKAGDLNIEYMPDREAMKRWHPNS